MLVIGDAPDPTAAASEATRLATREGVKIITGTFSSILCGAASEAAARQNVIYWETSCVDPRFTRRGLKNVFRTEIDGIGFGWYNVEFIAKYLAPRLGKKPSELRIAYIAEDSSYGQGVTEAARERAKKEFGMQEVALEYYTFTTNDLTPVILKLKNANPDVLHHIARDQDAILFWRQAREQNFEVKAVVHAGATGYGNPSANRARASSSTSCRPTGRRSSMRSAKHSRPRPAPTCRRAGISWPRAACGFSSSRSTRRRPMSWTSSAPRSSRWTCRWAA